MKKKAWIPMKAIASLESRSKFFWAMIGVVLIALVGLLDFETGYEISFSLFYLLPIFLVVWFGGKRLGVAASIVSALVELSIDVLSGHHYSQPVFYLWNAAIQFGFYLILTLFLARLKETQDQDKNLIRTDYLTGATSSRLFYALLQKEIDLFPRHKHPFTVAYADIDNFKVVNDRFGHSTGDTVLRTAVTLTKNALRKTDIVARLGGDEFAILLPETDQIAAQVVISKIQKGLISEMSKSNWPVTFSIGVITFMAAPATTIELIKLVDDLMYTVKDNGKNAIRYSVYAG